MINFNPTFAARSVIKPRFAGEGQTKAEKAEALITKMTQALGSLNRPSMDTPVSSLTYFNFAETSARLPQDKQSPYDIAILGNSEDLEKVERYLNNASFSPSNGNLWIEPGTGVIVSLWPDSPVQAFNG